MQDTSILDRAVKLEPNEYAACVAAENITSKGAAQIAVAHRNLATWHKRGLNLAMAAWWQSMADQKS